MSWLRHNSTTASNERWLKMWFTCTAFWSVYVGLSLSLVIISVIRGELNWLLVGLLNAAIGVFNARSSARILHSTTTKLAKKL
jgi:hypothetical protein